MDSSEKSDIIDLISFVGKRKFPSTRSDYGFSPKHIGEYVNISRKTIDNWLSGKTSPNRYQSKTIRDIFIRNGDLTKDSNQNIPFTIPDSFEELKKIYVDEKNRNESLKVNLDLIEDKLKDLQNEYFRMTNKILDQNDKILYLMNLLKKNDVDFDIT